MFGVLALVVAAGVCAGVVGVDSWRKQEYDARQKNATEQWKQAYHSFFESTTNGGTECLLEDKLGMIVIGSTSYPEIVDEIKYAIISLLADYNIA